MSNMIQIEGGDFQYPDGSPVSNGKLILKLSQEAMSPAGQVVSAVPITFTLDSSGSLPSSPASKIWSNEELSPSGTYYTAQVFDSNLLNVEAFTQIWVFSQVGGSVVDLGTMVPAPAPNPVYPGAVLLDPEVDQIIVNGLLTVNDGLASPGTSTFNIENAKVRNQVVFADQYAGSNMGAKIQAAHDALSSTGGTIDARGITGAQTWSTPVALSKPCVLLLGMGTFACSAAAISVSSNNVCIKGSGRFSTVISYAGSSPVDLISFRNGVSGIAYVGVYDLNTRFDTGAKASGSTQIHLYDAVSFELNNIYLSVDGTAGTMVNKGIVVETITTALVPPRGNGRIANITHSNSHDGSAANGAIALYLKGIAGTNGGLQQIAMEGEADLESSWVGVQCEYVSESNMSGAWYISGNNTNIKLINCVANTFITPTLNFAITENFNIGAGCTDTWIINPIFQTVATLGTDNGTRTCNLNSRGQAIRFGSTIYSGTGAYLNPSGNLNAKQNLNFQLNDVDTPTTGGIITGTFTGNRTFTFPDQSLTVSGLQVVGSSGTIANAAKIVTGSGALVSGAPSTLTVTLTSGAVFTNSGSYKVVVTNVTTAANGLKVTQSSGSAFTITGPNTVTDTINWIAVGN